MLVQHEQRPRNAFLLLTGLDPVRLYRERQRNEYYQNYVPHQDDPPTARFGRGTVTYREHGTLPNRPPVMCPLWSGKPLWAPDFGFEDAEKYFAFLASLGWKKGDDYLCTV